MQRPKWRVSLRSSLNIAQAPSTVNDCARLMMSSIRTQMNDAAWFNWGYNVTKIAGNKFSVTSATANTVTISNVFILNGRIKLYDTSTMYGTITEVSASATSVNVTFLPDSGSLTASFSSMANSIIKPTNTPIPISGSSIIDKIALQIFLTSGTYTPTTGMKYCIIQVVGAGGGGGGAATTNGSQFAAAGGGGAGESAYSVFTAASIGVSKTVTVGAAGLAGTAGANTGGTGGTTSVGSTLISAIGGSGGAGGAATATGATTSGGAGGQGGTGVTVDGFGAAGGQGLAGPVQAFLFSGFGASSVLGGGGAPVVNTAGATAATGGSGGSGGSLVINQTQVAGGAGGGGAVIITEYCSV